MGICWYKRGIRLLAVFFLLSATVGLRDLGYFIVREMVWFVRICMVLESLVRSE